MVRIKRGGAIVVAVLAVGVAGAACQSGAADDDGTPPASAQGLTIGLTYVPNVQFAPWYVAEEAGYFEDLDVDVHLRHHGQDEELFGALDAGDEDVVVVGGDEILQARSTGVEVTSFATMYQDYPVRILVPDDSGIDSLEDLRGRTIGTPGKFGQTWFGLLAILDQAGIDQDDVTIDEVGFTQQSALAGEHVDAVVGFINNDVPQFRSTGLQVRALDQPDLPLVGIGMGARDDVVAEQGQELTAIVEAVQHAVEDIEADPDVAVSAATDVIPGTVTDEEEQVMLATIEATAPLYGTLDSAWGNPDPGRWDDMAEFMAGEDLLSSDISGAEAVTTDLPGSD